MRKDKPPLTDKINEFHAILPLENNFFNLKLNLQFACFVWSKMSVKGIIMFLGMNNTRLERKIRIFLDFDNGFLPTYLPLCVCSVDLCGQILDASRVFDIQSSIDILSEQTSPIFFLLDTLQLHVSAITL